MTTVYIQLSFEVIGKNAGEAARVMRASVEDGKIDLPVMQTLEDEFDTIPGDWRIVAIDSKVTEGGQQ
mgnify:CR=1 FL=1